jgi:hypothetical protein
MALNGVHAGVKAGAIWQEYTSSLVRFHVENYIGIYIQTDTLEATPVWCCALYFIWVHSPQGLGHGHVCP